MADIDDEFDDDIDLGEEFMMPDSKIVRVKKGEQINITRIDPTIRDVTIGIGWDLKRFEGDPIDVDASVFLLNKNDKTVVDEDFVFYNNLVGRDGAVKHMGDSRTGAGDGDDEQIIIDLMSLPFEIVRIVFTLSIYDLDMSNSNFSMVKNVYFRVVNNVTGLETFRFELDDDMGQGTGLIIGSLERIGSEWVYQAMGEEAIGGLVKLASDYGIIVAQSMRA